MLADFNASDQIVVFANGITGRTDPAIRFDVRTDFTDGVFRNVKAIGFHTAVSKTFNEKAFCASNIQRRPRPEVADNLVGYSAEKLQPMRVFASVYARTETAVGVVVVVIVFRGGRSRDGTRRVPRQLGLANVPVRHMICEAPV